MMTTSTGTPSVDPFHDFWLTDYCLVCLAAGRDRRAVMTELDAVTWRGGKRLVCEYRCDGCGHEWGQADLWTAECAGFDPIRARGRGHLVGVDAGVAY